MVLHISTSLVLCQVPVAVIGLPKNLESNLNLSSTIALIELLTIDTLSISIMAQLSGKFGLL